VTRPTSGRLGIEAIETGCRVLFTNVAGAIAIPDTALAGGTLGDAVSPAACRPG